MIKLTTRWSSMNSTYVVRSRKSLKLVKLGKITTHFFSEPFWLISLFAMLRGIIGCLYRIIGDGLLLKTKCQIT